MAIQVIGFTTLQATAAKGVAGATANNKQYDGGTVLLVFQFLDSHDPEVHDFQNLVVPSSSTDTSILW